MADVVIVAVGGKLALDIDLITVLVLVAASAVGIGIAALNHKVADNSVECKSVIESALGEAYKVLYGDGCGGGVKQNYHFTVVLDADLNVLYISSGNIAALKIFAGSGAHFFLVAGAKAGKAAENKRDRKDQTECSFHIFSFLSVYVFQIDIAIRDFVK